MESIYNRVFQSIDKSHIDYNTRESAGVQPSLPFVNVQSLLIANVSYFVISFILYQIMSRRQNPLPVKPFIIVYNVICIFLAGSVVYGIGRYKWNHPGNFACSPIDTSEDGRDAAWYIWLFLMQKFWEFFDTWFFLMRKSFRQLTFLHLFHHSSITIVVACIVNYDFNGNVYLPAFLNAFIHVLMYSHYLVTSLGYKSWWSQYLTSLQLIQFVLITVQSVYSYYLGPQCSYDFIKVLLTVYMGSMLVLFSNFFIQQYIKKPTRPAGANEKEAKKSN